MVIHVNFIGVRGKADTYDAMVNALYGHSHVVGKVEGGDNEFVALIRTERQDEGSCRYNAQSQADRLRSFMRWRVVGPFEDMNGFNQHEEFFGIAQCLERV